MKAPKYAIATMQEAINAGINAFAFQLLAESFSDDPSKFGDENLLLIAHDHKGRQVFFIVTKTLPTMADFDSEVQL